MQTLLRAYRDAKDNNGRTGASPCIAPFLEEMDELFGKKPNFAKSDSYNFGAKSVSSSGATVSSPNTSSAAPLFSSSETFESPVSNDSDFFDVDVEFFLEEAAACSSSLPTTTPPSPTPPPPTTTTLLTTTTPPTRTPATSRRAAIKKRAMSRSDYYKEKIMQRQREAERVEERFQERQQARAQLQLKKAEDRKKKYELIEKLLSK
ncbi:PH domain-containing protein DDB_G0287875-like [Eupeodes corollae]|uniref:PH domain-containing protein DDB_G0287875-like n=1 Tax=Eupeodes corollae TaxID=290404 RepID=UPI0024929589|nr:PH domain-containing protein DDB_G0287875-like [Eupeodes corollae]